LKRTKTKKRFLDYKYHGVTRVTATVIGLMTLMNFVIATASQKSRQDAVNVQVHKICTDPVPRIVFHERQFSDA
jgi:hypothetical protein